jgi:uncharacterized lipoprotein YmbA
MVTMNDSARVTRRLAAVALILLAGCFKLGRPTPPVEQYVLSGSGTAASPVSSTDPGTLAIGLRRLDLADYLATRLIVVRRGTHQIVVTDFRRWGEDPGDGINRSLAAHLRGAPPVKSVDVAPWAVRSQHDYLVQVHVSRFEGVADSAATEGGVHVLAAWDILLPADGTVLVRGSTDFREGRWNVGDFTALVTLLDAALARVALDIARCLSRVAATAAPTPAVCAP